MLLVLRPAKEFYHQVVQMDTSAGDATGSLLLFFQKVLSRSLLLLSKGSGGVVLPGGTQLINEATSVTVLKVAVAGTAVGAQMGALSTAEGYLYYAKVSALR